MPLESAEDRLAILEALGEQVTYTPYGGSGSSIHAVFDNSYASAALFGVEMETSSPTVTVRAEDISGVARRDTITRSGETYEVIEVHPDGTGITLLIMSAA